MRIRPCVWSLAAIALAASPSHAAICALDPVPAASLLIPYFEVGSDCTVGSPDPTTTFVLTNTSRNSVLARVTVWSNAGVPGLSFDIYLKGYDRQDVDLRRVLCDGWLPSTGAGVLPGPGPLSQPAVNFTSCNATANAAGGAPVYGGDGAISAADTNALRTGLRGQPLPNSPGNCIAIPNGRDSAEGYLTIDAVTRCGAISPGAPGFDADLATSNVLIASAVLLDNDDNASVHIPAIALEAPGANELGTSTSFYAGNGIASAARREPLPGAWQVEAGPAGFTDAELIVWRAPPGPGAAFVCTAGPSWHPLQTANDTGYASRGVFHVLDDGRALATLRLAPFPRRAQRVVAREELPELAGVAGGWSWMNLASGHTPAPFPSQAWVGVVRRSAGRFDVLHAGTPADNGCDGTAFDNTSPGPLQQFAGDPP